MGLWASLNSVTIPSKGIVELSNAGRVAWALINRFERGSRQHVGLWHETYIVPAGSYESIYGDMPPYGLAAATGVLPVEQRGVTARERLGGV